MRRWLSGWDVFSALGFGNGPVAMFTETVAMGGKCVPRFARVAKMTFQVRRSFKPKCQGGSGKSAPSTISPASTPQAMICSGRGRMSSDGPRGVARSLRQ